MTYIEDLQTVRRMAIEAEARIQQRVAELEAHRGTLVEKTKERMPGNPLAVTLMHDTLNEQQRAEAAHIMGKFRDELAEFLSLR